MFIARGGITEENAYPGLEVSGERSVPTAMVAVHRDSIRVPERENSFAVREFSRRRWDFNHHVFANLARVVQLQRRRTIIGNRFFKLC